MYIADRNTWKHRFDLSNPDGLSRYAGFLEQIKKRAGELHTRFESVKPALLERARTEAGRMSLRWTLRSQFNEYSLWDDVLGEEKSEEEIIEECRMWFEGDQ